MDEQNNIAGSNVPGQPAPLPNPIAPIPEPNFQPPPTPQPQPMANPAPIPPVDSFQPQPAPPAPQQPLPQSFGPSPNPGVVAPPPASPQVRESSWVGITPTLPQNPVQPPPPPPPPPQPMPGQPQPTSQPTPPSPQNFPPPPNRSGMFGATDATQLTRKQRLFVNIAVVVTVLGVLLFTGLRILGSKSIALEEYKSEKVGFSIRRPKGWEVVEQTLSTRFSETKETAVSIEDDIKAGATMEVHRVYIGKADKTELLKAFDEEVSDSLGTKSIEITKKSDTKISGYDARVYDVKGVDKIGGKDVPMEGRVVVIFTDKQYAYTLAMESPQKRKAFIAVFDEIVASLKLSPPEI